MSQRPFDRLISERELFGIIQDYPYQPIRKETIYRLMNQTKTVSIREHTTSRDIVRYIFLGFLLGCMFGFIGATLLM